MNSYEFCALSRDDQTFLVNKLSGFPSEIGKLFFQKYMDLPTPFERNSYIRMAVESLSKKLCLSIPRLQLNLDEEGLRVKAKYFSQYVTQIRQSFMDDSSAIEMIEKEVIKEGISSLGGRYSSSGKLARYCTENWWLRKLRVQKRRGIETALHFLNEINKQKSLYCSQLTLEDRRFQKKYQLQYLAKTFVSNELGQSFSLLELSKRGVSNPINRKNELMVRARGFEDVAKDLGHEARFLTITCPSKYHRAYARSGQKNVKWGGYTPLDAQEYLQNNWELIRSKLNREGIRYYGFRVVEPQHDGTPHWHLLLFSENADSDEMVNIIREYSMRVDGNEQGAKEHRFTDVRIDSSKGSATGYICKYISKNIDGSGIDSGTYGEDPRDCAERVDAWAACWGIRQFQQLGGCSVTVWRELRRLKQMDALEPKLERIAQAADSGDWKTFTIEMGGVYCPRNKQTFRPFYELDVDTATGLVRTSIYSTDEFVRVLKGVVACGRTIVTRIHKWRQVDPKLHSFNLEFCE